MKLEKATNILETLYNIEDILRDAMNAESDVMRKTWICMALEKTKKVRKEVAESNVQII